ncbi:MAG: hypothetical protein Q4B15_06380, partial [Lachnospiraceae bacterium]|nr:hypothetical protein [Lachnospiraceae bacterium]
RCGVEQKCATCYCNFGILSRGTFGQEYPLSPSYYVCIKIKVFEVLCSAINCRMAKIVIATIYMKTPAGNKRSFGAFAIVAKALFYLGSERMRLRISQFK